MSNTTRMIQARQQQAANAEKAATIAIRKLVRAGRPVTFAAVAANAGVSTGYLYRHPHLADTIRQHRPANRIRPSPTPANDSITSALREHIRALTEAHQGERAELAAQVDQLRAELDAALGELITLRRSTRTTRRTVDHAITDKD